MYVVVDSVIRKRPIQVLVRVKVVVVVKVRALYGISPNDDDKGAFKTVTVLCFSYPLRTCQACSDPVFLNLGD